MNRIDAREISGAVAQRGLHLCVGIPAGLLALGVVLRAFLPFLASPIVGEDTLKILGYAFIAVSASDVLAAFVVKKRLIRAEALSPRIGGQVTQFGPKLLDAFMPIFILAAAPALYGLIFYFLGGDLDTYVLISVFCPAGLLLLKPKEEAVEKLAEAVFGARGEREI